MKSTGIVRKVDDLGRMVIPIELRKNYEYRQKKTLWKFLSKKIGSYLKKYEPACIFCGSAKQTSDFQGKIICQSCIDKMETELIK